MKVDCRDKGYVPFIWALFDKVTGKNMFDEFVVAADDLTGQVVKHDKNSFGRPTKALISEFRDIELVCTEHRQ